MKNQLHSATRGEGTDGWLSSAPGQTAHFLISIFLRILILPEISPANFALGIGKRIASGIKSPETESTKSFAQNFPLNA